MFGFGRASKAGKHKVALRGVADGLPGKLQQGHPVEGAVILLVGNCFLDLAARLHGQALADDPAKGDAEAAMAALDGMLAARDKLAALVADGAAAASLRRAAATHQKAAELAILTVGVALDPALSRAAASAWHAAWLHRGRLREAVLWVRRYERESGVEAVPRLPSGAIPSDPDLMRIGNKVPPFLRRKR